VISCQGAFEPTNTWQMGRLPGSSSSTPRARPKTPGLWSNLLNRLEPQVEQKPLWVPGDDSK